MVLQAGRTLIALVPDVAESSLVSDRLDVVCNDASKTALWSRMLDGNKPRAMVGKDKLPRNVPDSNLPFAVAQDLASRSPGEHGSPELQLARMEAGAKGLEIKVCPG